MDQGRRGKSSRGRFSVFGLLISDLLYLISTPYRKPISVLTLQLEAASILASFANNILEFGGYKKRAREESVESVQTVEGACKRRR